MIISDSHKFIYIAIGRTGTTSLSHILGKYKIQNPMKMGQVSKPFIKNYRRFCYDRQKHMLARNAKKIINQNKWNNYFKFTIVRNPWDRMVSVFMERNHKDIKNKTKEKFKEFVLAGKGPDNKMIDFVLDENGKCLLDYIGRYERFDKECSFLFNKLGIEIEEIPHYNKREHKHYTEYYDEFLKGFIHCKYKNDIEYFGYSF